MIFRFNGQHRVGWRALTDNGCSRNCNNQGATLSAWRVLRELPGPTQSFARGDLAGTCRRAHPIGVERVAGPLNTDAVGRRFAFAATKRVFRHDLRTGRWSNVTTRGCAAARAGSRQWRTAADIGNLRRSGARNGRSIDAASARCPRRSTDSGLHGNRRVSAAPARRDFD